MIVFKFKFKVLSMSALPLVLQLYFLLLYLFQRNSKQLIVLKHTFLPQHILFPVPWNTLPYLVHFANFISSLKTWSGVTSSVKSFLTDFTLLTVLTTPSLYNLIHIPLCHCCTHHIILYLAIECPLFLQEQGSILFFFMSLVFNRVSV